MSKETTNDDVAEPTEDTTESGSILEKNFSRRTALVGAGLIGSAAASQSAGAVDITENEPGVAGDGSAPGAGNLAEVLSLNLESDDVIVDVSGSNDIGDRDYLKELDSDGNDVPTVAFPEPTTEVLPGDRISDIEPEDRLRTTRNDTFDLDNDHIYQSASLGGENELVYAPVGHALGAGGGATDLGDQLNPTIDVKVDSVGVDQDDVELGPVGGEPYFASDFFTNGGGNGPFTPPASGNNGQFDDRNPDNVVLVDGDGNIADEFDGTLNERGFEVQLNDIANIYEVVFEDHRQTIVLPNVQNDGELNEDEANTIGLQDDFSDLGADPPGIFLRLDGGNMFVISETFEADNGGADNNVNTGTLTVVSGQDISDISGQTFIQQNATDTDPVLPIRNTNTSGGDGAVNDGKEVYIPVTGGVEPEKNVAEGDPLGIQLDGTGFTQQVDATLLSTGRLDSTEEIQNQTGSDAVFDGPVSGVSGTDDGFYIRVVTEGTSSDGTIQKLVNLSPSDVSNLTILSVILEDAEFNGSTDTGTAHNVLLDTKSKIINQLQTQINNGTRSSASVDVADVTGTGDFFGSTSLPTDFTDATGDDSGYVIGSETVVEDPYQQAVDESSVEVEVGSVSAISPTANNVADDLGLEGNGFNSVNAETITDDDIYTIQADPLNLVTQDTESDEYLGDFEVTDNEIPLFEDSVELVQSKDTDRTDDLVFRDSLDSSASSAQDEASAGNESGAARFSPTRYHDGFDILELREPVEELPGDSVPHNPRGLDPSQTNVDVYYGDRFEGIRVRNEGNLEGDNIEVVELGMDDPRVGVTWTDTKTRGDAGFNESDTTFWFSKENLASGVAVDVVYFGDNSPEDIGAVDHRSDLTFSIDVEDANNVSDSQFGQTALFEVMDLSENSPADGNFDTGGTGTSAEQGLYFFGHGDRGDIQASDGISGGSSEIQLAEVYNPNNSEVPIEYIYGDGSIDTQGLLDAIRDFRDNEISTQRLLDAITEFR
jgi:hypothetical protein